MSNQTAWKKHKGQHHEILESFLTVAPFLNTLFQEDVSMGVADLDKYLLSTDGDVIKLNIPYGEALREGDAITEAIKTRKTVRMMVPKEVFGFPIVATGIPIFDDNGNIIGGVGLGVSLSQYSTLYNIASELSRAVTEITVALEDLAKSTGTLAISMDKINNQSNEVLKNIDKIQNFSKAVENVSSRSHVLGMNASIEAARAGDAGRGFAVVAEEMRKMALSSKENTDQIQKVIKETNALISGLDTSISMVNSSTENQSTVTEQLSATMREINQNAQMLSDLAEKSLSMKK